LNYWLAAHLAIATLGSQFNWEFEMWVLIVVLITNLVELEVAR